MRSFLLGQLALVLSVAGLIVGAGLLAKGHSTPGGGFVAGISFAFVVVLLIAGYDTGWFRTRMPVDPESLVLVAVAVMLGSAFVPVLLGAPALTQDNVHVSLPGTEWDLHSALLFDSGVALAIGAGLSSAVLVLWERLVSEKRTET